MQRVFNRFNQRPERTWGWPFWSGTVIGLIVIGMLCQITMFDGVSTKSILGSLVVSLAPAILLGVLAQTLGSLVRQTHAGVFGPVHYVMISLSGLLAVAAGLSFSSLPEHCQEALPLVIEPIIWVSLFVVFIVARKKRQST